MTLDPKKWYFSRTLWLAVLQGVLGVVIVINTQAPTIGWIVVLKSILDILVRISTSQPVTL